MEEKYKTCSSCGKKEKEDSKFCGRCGKSFEIKEMLKKECIKCKKKIEIEDFYCKYCGRVQSNNGLFKYSLVGIILSFLIIGPLCIIPLWKSQTISKGMKIFLSFAFIIMSIIIIFAIVEMVNKIIEQYKELGI